jgi:hypothetical protein
MGQRKVTIVASEVKEVAMISLYLEAELYPQGRQAICRELSTSFKQWKINPCPIELASMKPGRNRPNCADFRKELSYHILIMITK